MLHSDKIISFPLFLIICITAKMSLNMMHVVHYIGKINCDTTGTFVIRIFHDKIIRFSKVITLNPHMNILTDTVLVLQAYVRAHLL